MYILCLYTMTLYNIGERFHINIMWQCFSHFKCWNIHTNFSPLIVLFHSCFKTRPKPKIKISRFTFQLILNCSFRHLQQCEIWCVWWQWFLFLTGYAKVFIYSCCCYRLGHLYLEVTGSQSKMKDISLFGSHVQSLCSVFSIHLPWQPGIVIAFHLVSCKN